MKRIFFAGAAALAMIAVPSAAQVSGAGPEATAASVSNQRAVDMSERHRAMYDALPAEQRTAFDTWEPDRQVMYFGWDEALRGYYWNLEPAQQDAWWYLDDAQRISLFQLEEGRRDTAWNSIIEQVNSIKGNQQAAAGSTQPSAAAPANGDPAYSKTEVAQSTPAAQQPSDYPVCTEEITDSCINAWAAGQRGPGVTRPLDHWPGEPSSS